MFSSLFDERFFGFIYDSIAFTLIFSGLYNLKNKPGCLDLFKNAYVHTGISTYLKGFVLFLSTLIIGMLCYGFAPAFLNTGWLDLLGLTNGADNLVLQPLKNASSGSFELGGIRVTVYLFFIALILLLPSIAQIEENYFRKGYVETKDILKQTVKFGFAHLLVGIPIIFAFVLMIPGYAYARHYRTGYFKGREMGYNEKEATDCALMKSLSLHAIFNLYVLTAILLSMVFL